MSTTLPPQTPTPDAGAAPVPEATAPVRRPLLWLLAIVAVGLVLRLWSLGGPFQQDEFGALYAVAERQTATPGATPVASDPLAPVASWQEVRDRSVLPYGVTNPVPLYHYLLYGVIQAVPVADWSLRLPSLLAGIACLVGVYWLCRRLFGAEVALVAALFAALDPLLIGASVIARPYALANLACVLSFGALLGLLRSRCAGKTVLAAAGYGVALAFIGYLNAALLLVVLAHVGVVVYWAVAGGFKSAADGEDAEKAPERPVAWSKVLACLAGCGLAALLLTPEVPYWLELARFTRVNRETIMALMPPQLFAFVEHNSTFLVCLVVIMVAGYVAARVPREEGDMDAEGETGEAKEQPGVVVAEVKPAAPASPPPVMETPQQMMFGEAPDNPDLVWLARVWLFVPQLAVLLLAFGCGLAILYSRYLAYTSLGAVILLAYWATRSGAREVRLSVTAAVALAMFFWGFTGWSRGYGLYTAADGKPIMERLAEREEKGRWKPGDVVLVRTTFVEAYFLPDRIPEANRARVEKAIVAPYETLYLTATPKPVVCLGLSLFRADRFNERTERFFRPDDQDEARLAQRLRGYQGYWVLSHDGGQQAFMKRFVPWLADAADSDLKVARRREAEDQRYFTVKKGLKPEEMDAIDGLANSLASDFATLVRIEALRQQ